MRGGTAILGCGVCDIRAGAPASWARRHPSRARARSCWRTHPTPGHRQTRRALGHVGVTWGSRGDMSRRGMSRGGHVGVTWGHVTMIHAESRVGAWGSLHKEQSPTGRQCSGARAAAGIQAVDGAHG
eukprot:5504481-Prymnesium_polylepis.1